MTQYDNQVTRVAMVVRPAAGGIRSHVRTLLTGLDAARFRCELYGPTNLDLDSNEAHHIPIDIRAQTVPVADLRAILHLAACLRGKADLVHAHGLRGALIGVPAARLAGIPALFTAHNLLPDLNWLQRRLLCAVATQAAAIVAVSEAVATQLSAIGISRNKLTVVPNGVDPEPFMRAYDSMPIRTHYSLAGVAEAPLIVSIGRLAPEKGFDVLIRAMYEPQLAAEGVHLALAGAGPEEANLRRLADAYPNDSEKRVHLLGNVTAIAPLLAAADLVVIPSRVEGQGIVALEAMAAGRAIVASRVGGLIETIIDGECGSLVSPDDAVALARAAAILIADPQLRARYGHAGRLRVIEKYTATRMIANIAALYATVARHQALLRNQMTAR